MTIPFLKLLNFICNYYVLKSTEKCSTGSDLFCESCFLLSLMMSYLMYSLIFVLHMLVASKILMLFSSSEYFGSFWDWWCQAKALCLWSCSPIPCSGKSMKYRENGTKGSWSSRRVIIRFRKSVLMDRDGSSCRALATRSSADVYYLESANSKHLLIEFDAYWSLTISPFCLTQSSFPRDSLRTLSLWFLKKFSSKLRL